MRVAVTGSTGLIGTALVARLRGEGHQVVHVVRGDPPPGRARHQHVPVGPARGEIDHHALEGVDAVVHLAGASIGGKRWSDEWKRTVLESRTRGTALLAEALAALDQRPAVLVSGSGVHYYGDRGDEVLTEQSSPGELFLSEVCRRWEAAATTAALAGVRVVYLRTGPVISPTGGFLAKMLPLFRFALGGRLGSGRQWWSPISLDDMVGGIRHLIDTEVTGPVNLTLPQPVTNREFTETLAKVLHRPAFVPVPAFGPRLLLGRRMADELLFASLRVEPRVLTDSGYEFRHPDLESALRSQLARPGLTPPS